MKSISHLCKDARKIPFAAAQAGAIGKGLRITGVRLLQIPSNAGPGVIAAFAMKLYNKL